MRFLGCAFLFLLVLATTPARADYGWSAGNVVCDAQTDVALARVTQGYNEDAAVYAPLPADADGGLSAVAATTSRECVMKNGWQVRLRIGSEQAFPYGAGGASPPQFFSLWVDNRKVISRRVWMRGYDDIFQPTPRIVGVVVRPERLTVCSVFLEKMTCADEALALDALPVDEIEYPPPGRAHAAPGTMEMPVGADNPLCRSLIKRGKLEPWTAGDIVFDVNFNAFDQPDAGEIEWLDVRPFLVDVLAWSAQSHGYKQNEIDLDGDGRKETVLRAYGGSHAFDGTYWYVVASGVPFADVEQEIFPPNQTGRDEEDDAKAKHERWWVYSGGVPGVYPKVSIRYVHLTLLAIDGRFYFFATPTAQRHEPTALLIKPLPHGHFETVCVFQQVRPNY